MRDVDELVGLALRNHLWSQTLSHADASKLVRSTNGEKSSSSSKTDETCNTLGYGQEEKNFANPKVVGDRRDVVIIGERRSSLQLRPYLNRLKPG